MAATAEPTVLVERSGGVLGITLNRPARRNAVDPATLTAFDEAVQAAAAAADCRVILLRGAGQVFCAGWDLQAIAAMRASGDAAAARASFERNREVLDRLAASPQVVVSLVQGAALGFGLGLLSRSDIVLAASSAVFGLPEIGVGVVPAIVMLDVYRQLGEKTALDWLLTGETRSAHEAAAAGVVTRVADDLGAAGAMLVERLLGHDPETLRETKALYRRLHGLDERAATRTAIDAAVCALMDDPPQHTG
jgi:methylglutaconyl-CoA hydratase